MNILGVSCGRDASASVLRGGVLVAHVIRERITRQRHAAGICRATIEEALATAKISPAEIDKCAVVLAPRQTPICHNPNYFDVQDKGGFAPFTGDEREGDLCMDFPVQVILDGRVLSGVGVRAHAAHAASAFFCSGFEKAAVLTHDSGAGWESGLLFCAEAGKLRAVKPHGLAVAALYNRIADLCGLGEGGAGKLMGLSAYGKPLQMHEGPGPSKDDVEAVIQALLAEAHKQGYDFSTMGNTEVLPSPLAAALAASAQKIFSDRMLKTVRAFLQVLREQGMAPQGLCLGGGAALNCPSNSRILRESGYDSVFIPPYCDNSGLSVGAAQWLWHNVLEHPSKSPKVCESRWAMTGRDRSAGTPLVLAGCGALFNVEVVNDAPSLAAQDIARNKIIGWFEGASEAGSRALGHRSILADPRDVENGRRVNAIKARERWRPFAPVCLLSDLQDWFDGPSPSPFMLFTHTVREDKRLLIPAVVHVDGSSRVQTVVPQDGGVYELLKTFKGLSGIPLVLNTSFNGANEPIVETPQDAVAFFQKGLLDVLYIEGFRVTRKD